MRVVSILISLLLSVVKCGKQSHPIWDRLNLPPEHIPFFFNNHPEIKEKCALDPKCNFKVSVQVIRTSFSDCYTIRNS